MTGAGTAHLAGSTDKLTLKLSGAGGIEAAGLKSSSADVQISGAGNATVWAADELNARISGAGGIKYKGTPKVEQKVSGAGRIRPSGMTPRRGNPKFQHTNPKTADRDRIKTRSETSPSRRAASGLLRSCLELVIWILGFSRRGFQ